MTSFFAQMYCHDEFDLSINTLSVVIEEVGFLGGRDGWGGERMIESKQKGPIIMPRGQCCFELLGAYDDPL